MKNVSMAAMTLTAFSFLMLGAAGCVGADVPEDIAQDDGVTGGETTDDIAQDDGVIGGETTDDIAQDDGLIGEAQGALVSSPPGAPASLIGTCGRYCVYALSGASVPVATGCSNDENEAKAYRDSLVGWKGAAHFDTIRDGVQGWVKFLIPDALSCSPTQKYQLADLNTLSCNPNDTFISASGNENWSHCNRIRVWEHANFNGYDMACRAPGWCPILKDGPLDLRQQISSWRMLDQ